MADLDCAAFHTKSDQPSKHKIRISYYVRRQPEFAREMARPGRRSLGMAVHLSCGGIDRSAEQILVSRPPVFALGLCPGDLLNVGDARRRYAGRVLDRFLPNLKWPCKQRCALAIKEASPAEHAPEQRQTRRSGVSTITSRTASSNECLAWRSVLNRDQGAPRACVCRAGWADCIDEGRTVLGAPGRHRPIENPGPAGGALAALPPCTLTLSVPRSFPSYVTLSYAGVSLIWHAVMGFMGVTFVYGGCQRVTHLNMRYVDPLSEDVARKRASRIRRGIMDRHHSALPRHPGPQRLWGIVCAYAWNGVQASRRVADHGRKKLLVLACGGRAKGGAAPRPARGTTLFRRATGALFPTRGVRHAVGTGMGEGREAAFGAGAVRGGRLPARGDSVPEASATLQKCWAARGVPYCGAPLPGVSESQAAASERAVVTASVFGFRTWVHIMSTTPGPEVGRPAEPQPEDPAVWSPTGNTPKAGGRCGRTLSPMGAVTKSARAQAAYYPSTLRDAAARAHHTHPHAPTPPPTRLPICRTSSVDQALIERKLNGGPVAEKIDRGPFERAPTLIYARTSFLHGREASSLRARASGFESRVPI
ncbi:hypothetical protein JB92DRAFT_3101177 [Gautieria morchelliformis]|nr:hypothetical protein JB92DRAFT_3101177 [Gautieria morchelliformis]